jgi:hypothetical protein
MRISPENRKRCPSLVKHFGQSLAMIVTMMSGEEEDEIKIELDI